MKYIFFAILFYTRVFLFAQTTPYSFSKLTVKEGLVSNQINCFLKDREGFIWIGTVAGLARFDGNGFRTYKNRPGDSTSLIDNDIRAIMEGPNQTYWIETRGGMQIYRPSKDCFDRLVSDNLKQYSIIENSVRAVRKESKGEFWFISNSSGIYHYSAIKKKTKHITHIAGRENTIIASPIIDLTPDHKGYIWVIHTDGVIEKINRHTNKVELRISVANLASKKESVSYRLFNDSDGLIWIYDHMTLAGVVCFDPSTGAIRQINKTSAPLRLSSDIVSGIIEDHKNNIWIATDHGGINIIDKKNWSVQYILSSEEDNNSLSQNNLYSIYYDDLKTIWIGTSKKGVNFFHPNIIKFGLIKHSYSPESLVYNDINDLAEDQHGNLWMGTNGKGLVYYNRNKNIFSVYKHSTTNINSISNEIIGTLFFDKSKKLWIGTYSGGLDCFDGKKFIHYKNNKADLTSLSDNRVTDIFEDSSSRLWIATSGGGINLLDRVTQKFTRYSVLSGHISSNFVFTIMEDSEKNIWFGTAYGINILLKETGRFITIFADSKTNSLINNSINVIKEDRKGNIWIGTREGLSIYNPRSKRYFNFTTAHGLANNNIQDIQFDHNQHAWLASSNGLSKAVPTSGAGLTLNFTNFDENDGLQGKEFNRNSSIKLHSGELVFGGADGVNIFQPAQIKTFNYSKKPVITEFSLFGQPLRVNQIVDNKVILKSAIVDKSEITLNHYQNVFSIQFASLNYIEPHTIKYQYMMEGFDQSWITADNTVRTATYTNLDPGSYIFKVQASNSRGQWEEPPLELRIHIQPPFYKTNLAYFIYFLSVASILYLLRQRGIKKLKIEFEVQQKKEEMARIIEQEKLEAQRQIEQERLEATKARELDTLKIKFLTNISHEFRTPLSLIFAPIDKLLAASENSNTVQDHLLMVKRNARRLLNLVNQLLDFRRMELKENNIHRSVGNLVTFVKDIVWSFKDLAEQKQIQLSFHSGITELYTAFDHDKVERILFNILSNAFKFTLENGKIAVLLDVEASDWISIQVRDTGIGIPKEKQSRIFDSFFQSDVPSSLINQGTGIGLSIAKEFVELHGGKILLDSEPGLGSCFIVRLPFADKKEIGDSAISYTEETIVDQHTVPTASKVEIPANVKKQIILIVEDDADFRFYLKDNLREEFHIIEANNGQDGWRKALFHHPSLVLSDISMPEMDGVQLCQKIKEDKRTTHIPVILLTAAIGDEKQLVGLGSGANDYITKPFSFEILLSKVRNILAQQESFKRTYQKQLDVIPPPVEVESQDEKFLHEVVQLIEKNISNSNFSVDELSSLLFISRVTLYKRMVNLTGKTPLEFIKSFRMKRAAQLLKTGNLSVFQVSYKVGFKTQKHFVKLFKAEFGVSPSQYKGTD